MIILSIDSGIERTGYAVFDHTPKRTDFKISGLIKTSAKKTTSLRLHEIFEGLEAVIKKYKPTMMVVEQLFFFKNAKTVITVAQAQGITQLLAAQHHMPIEFLTPLQIKQIVTGYGNSDKESVKKMIGLTHPQISLTAKIDDEIDAIACGLAYCFLNKNLM